MFFVGDIAVPIGAWKSLPEINDHFSNNSVIANLEGAIVLEEGVPRGTSLYNDGAVLAYLRRNNVRLVSLANNHITDFNRSPRTTIDALKKYGVLSCGAGESLKEASSPVLLKDQEGDVVFLGFGWDTIGCRIASTQRPGVNPLERGSVLDGIRKATTIFSGKPIVLLMHWNYELELYPQPMHRQIAYMAIEHGVSAVIGCHSHCVQGIEIYQGCPVVYGLGNWFLPEGMVFGRNLRFPDFALRQLAFEWAPSTPRKMKCHWFAYNRETKSVDFEMSEDLRDSVKMEELTPFAGMNHRDYVKWFKEHRRKKLLLPIYENSNSHLINKIKNMWVKSRHFLISTAVTANWKSELR